MLKLIFVVVMDDIARLDRFAIISEPRLLRLGKLGTLRAYLLTLSLCVLLSHLLNMLSVNSKDVLSYRGVASLERIERSYIDLACAREQIWCN